MIQDCMKKNVISVRSSTTVLEAAHVFVKKHVGLLPVVDAAGKPLGMIQLADLLTLELPDFITLVSDLDFVHDFGAVEITRPTSEQLEAPVTSLMQPVRTVEEDCGLLRGYALMLQHELIDMPVIDCEGSLVGIVSRVDIGTAILSLWREEGS